jgi:two-component sensor histidine kinase
MTLKQHEFPKLRLVRDASLDPDTVSFIASTQVQLPSVVTGLLGQSDDCVKVLEVDGALSFMNCNGREAMHIADFSSVQGKLWWELWPEDDRPMVQSSVLAAAQGRSVRFEGFCPTAQGEPRWWDVSVSPMRNDRGEVCALLSTSRDVTARRSTQQSLEAMALEMRHRLRNAYTISAALAEMSGRADSEHGTFAKELAERLRRLGLAQSRVLDAVEGSDRLPLLILALVKPFDEAGGTMDVNGIPDIVVLEKAARAIALVLGELCTNSMKYGAFRRGGNIVLRGEHVGTTLMLRWSESANLNPDPVLAETGGGGSGFPLMRKMLEAHSGRLDVRWVSRGLEVSILLDVAQ